jgi:epoxyqueuosine reductase
MKILLHACCAPCGGQVINELKKQGHEVAVFFFNPNVYPQAEYELRMKEVKRYCDKLGVELIEGKYEHTEWLDKVKGHETDPEKGDRCKICFGARLSEVAQVAAELGFEAIATTLTISPHKEAEVVNQVGEEVCAIYGLKFINEIWRKNDGYKKSCRISHDEDFHRQDYCGCEFSRRVD